MLVVVLDDEPDAVSALPPGFSLQWRVDTENGLTPTARVAEHLGVSFISRTPTLSHGHDLVLLADVGRGMTIRRAGGMHHLNAEPQTAIGYGSEFRDIDWMRKAGVQRHKKLAVRRRARRRQTPRGPAGQRGRGWNAGPAGWGGQARPQRQWPRNCPRFRHRFWARNRHIGCSWTI